MGGFDPVSLAFQAFSLVQGQSQARAQAKAQSQQIDAQRQAAQRQFDAAEAERRERTERALAAQRASFAAAGISDDGSGRAVAGSLLADSERERSALSDAFQAEMARFDQAGRVNLLRRRESNLQGLGGAIDLARRNLPRFTD